MTKRTLNIAVEGCAHGELNVIYERLSAMEAAQQRKADLLIICGDFEAIRNEADMYTIARPAKYHRIGQFWQYYSGRKRAPVLTLYVGGNHEASAYHWDLFYGGWVAPNIYYMGFSNVVRFGGLRIAGLSGIYKENDYEYPHHERHALNPSTMRSIYHTRAFEVYKILLLQKEEKASVAKDKVDIMITHDWPRGIEQYGNVSHLLKMKPFFQQEIATNSLGSPPYERILHDVRPRRWFSAHLHVRYAATVQHTPHLDDSPSHQEIGPETTQFLALDKPGPRRQYLEIVQIETDLPEGEEPLLTYDAEWLAIVKATQSHMHFTRERRVLPSFAQIHSKIKEIQPRLQELDLKIPTTFEMTVPPYHPQHSKEESSPTASDTPDTTPPLTEKQDGAHPQTQAYCDLVGIETPHSICASLPAMPADAETTERSNHHHVRGHQRRHNPPTSEQRHRRGPYQPGGRPPHQTTRFSDRTPFAKDTTAVQQHTTTTTVAAAEPIAPQEKIANPDEIMIDDDDDDD